MDSNASLLEAYDEVSAVAEELKALRQKAREYAGASERLANVSDVLGQLTESIVKMQDLFSAVVGKAEQVQNEICESKDRLDRVVNSIPEIIERIESTDAAKSLSRIADMVTAVQGHAAATEESTKQAATELKTLIMAFTALKKAWPEQVKALERLNQILETTLKNGLDENRRLLLELQTSTQKVVDSNIALGQRITAMRKALILAFGAILLAGAGFAGFVVYRLL